MSFILATSFPSENDKLISRQQASLFHRIFWRHSFNHPFLREGENLKKRVAQPIKARMLPDSQTKKLERGLPALASGGKIMVMEIGSYFFLCEGKEMIMSKMIISVLLAVFLLSCAAGQPLQKEPENIPVGSKSSEKDDASSERLKALEQSVSSLRSEVANLGYRLNNMQARSSLTSFKLPKQVSLCGEVFPLEDRNIWENLDREFLLALSNEAQVLLWMKRARRYFPLIEKKLKEMGLPDDLKYVTITESSLRPEAVSSSGAGGIWQFIPSTGEKYGMRRNRSIDERFDFFKATEGALSYLKCLYEEFKSWTLSMAAYNAGENRVRKEVDLQKTGNYFYLDLPLETERYVYKIAAAKIILSDPGRYGYTLEEKEFYSPLRVERVQIELTHPLPIMEVARATGFFYKEIKEMNPHLSDETIPPGTHFLNLPPGTSEKFWAFFSAWKKEMEGK